MDATLLSITLAKYGQLGLVMFTSLSLTALHPEDQSDKTLRVEAVENKLLLCSSSAQRGREPGTKGTKQKADDTNQNNCVFLV